MERKLNEFLALTQGTRTVLQYGQAFNNLCQYAGYHADTDAKKRDRFRRGLNTKLKERLNLARADTYNELVNMAITSTPGREEEKGTRWTIKCPTTKVSHRAKCRTHSSTKGPSAREMDCQTPTAARHGTTPDAFTEWSEAHSSTVSST